MTAVETVENGTAPVDTRAQGFARLREPFEASMVGKLPRATKKEAKKGKCKPAAEGGDAPGWQDYFCGGWHGLPAVHLDYAGHAAVTSRLLEVDPEWNWEPKAGWDENGEPRFVRVNGKPVRLWIDLTVLGVTRPGVGTVDAGVFDAEKQLIGDALRNAAMRFGVALDLWIKGSDEEAPTTVEPAPEPVKADAATHTAIRAAIKELEPAALASLQKWWIEAHMPPISKADRLSEAEANAVLAALEDLEADPEQAETEDYVSPTEAEYVTYVDIQRRHAALMPRPRKRADKLASDAFLPSIGAAMDPDDAASWAKLLDAVEAEAQAEHPPFPESS